MQTHSRRNAARSALGIVAALLVWCAPAAGQASGMQMPQLPRYVCRPCGEVAPPPGYSCAGPVMVYQTVKTVEIPDIVAACAKSTPPATPPASGSQQQQPAPAAPPDKAPPTPVPAAPHRVSLRQ